MWSRDYSFSGKRDKKKEEKGKAVIGTGRLIASPSDQPPSLILQIYPLALSLSFFSQRIGAQRLYGALKLTTLRDKKGHNTHLLFLLTFHPPANYLLE